MHDPKYDKRSKSTLEDTYYINKIRRQDTKNIDKYSSHPL